VGISFLEVERFIDHQSQQGLAPITINRRIYVLKHCFDFLIDQQVVGMKPVKPRHVVPQGRTLLKALVQEHI